MFSNIKRWFSTLKFEKNLRYALSDGIIFVNDKGEIGINKEKFLRYSSGLNMEDRKIFVDKMKEAVVSAQMHMELEDNCNKSALKEIRAFIVEGDPVSYLIFKDLKWKNVSPLKRELPVGNVLFRSGRTPKN